MRHKASDAQRLLILTLSLEAAVSNEDWQEVSSTLTARSQIIDVLASVPKDIAEQIAKAEDRMLSTLRSRLILVRADMRNLSAALRIASSYTKADHGSSLSLAG